MKLTKLQVKNLLCHAYCFESSPGNTVFYNSALDDYECFTLEDCDSGLMGEQIVCCFKDATLHKATNEVTFTLIDGSEETFTILTTPYNVTSLIQANGTEPHYTNKND